MDKLGTAFEAKTVASGFGSYLAQVSIVKCQSFFPLAYSWENEIICFMFHPGLLFIYKS